MLGRERKQGEGEKGHRVVEDTLSAEKTFEQGLKDLRGEVLQLSGGTEF